MRIKSSREKTTLRIPKMSKDRIKLNPMSTQSWIRELWKILSILSTKGAVRTYS